MEQAAQQASGSGHALDSGVSSRAGTRIFPGPILIGGDKTSVPDQLQPHLRGDYEN